MVIDEYIAKKIMMTDKYIISKYPQFFQPEIQPFINEKLFTKYDPKDSDKKLRKELVEEIKKELPEDFYDKRKEGENDSQISELIRKDMITEFIAYITRNDVSINATIQPSIYETNSFLLTKQERSNIFTNQNLTLIEYAAFFGSIQIFNYLQLEGVELTPSLWILAIHGHNSEMIHFLEDNHVELEDKSYRRVFYEAIKCHHNDIANYLINNFLQNDEKNSQNKINQCFQYHNFAFLKNESIKKSSFYNLCKYDYCVLVDKLLKDKVIHVNKKKNFFQYLINIISIDIYLIMLKSYISMKLKIISFNKIQNHIFQFHSKSYLSIEFKIIERRSAGAEF